MNLKVYFITVGLMSVLAWGCGEWSFRVGWNKGRAALVTQQRQQAQAQLAKQTTRQQANDSKAAAADDEGKAKTVTITQEVIRYIKTPGRNVCVFDDTRVKLKQAAVDNANHIEGYDRE